MFCFLFQFFSIFRERYLFKVDGKGPNGETDNCRYEFIVAENFKAPSRMIPVVMEPRCRSPDAWFGKAGFMLKGLLYVDFSDDSKLESAAEDIYQKIRSTIAMTVEERYRTFIASSSSVGAGASAAYDEPLLQSKAIPTAAERGADLIEDEVSNI